MDNKREDRRCPYWMQFCTLEDQGLCPVKKLEVWTALNVRLKAEGCGYAGEELTAAHYEEGYGMRVRRRPGRVY